MRYVAAHHGQHHQMADGRADDERTHGERTARMHGERQIAAPPATERIPDDRGQDEPAEHQSHEDQHTCRSRPVQQPLQGDRAPFSHPFERMSVTQQ